MALLSEVEITPLELNKFTLNVQTNSILAGSISKSLSLERVQFWLLSQIGASLSFFLLFLFYFLKYWCRSWAVSTKRQPKHFWDYLGSLYADTTSLHMCYDFIPRRSNLERFLSFKITFPQNYPSEALCKSSASFSHCASLKQPQNNISHGTNLWHITLQSAQSRSWHRARIAQRGTLLQSVVESRVRMEKSGLGVRESQEEFIPGPSKWIYMLKLSAAGSWCLIKTSK